MTAYETALNNLEEIRGTITQRKPIFDFAEGLKAALPDLKIHVSYGIGRYGQLDGILIHVNDLDDIRDVIPVCKLIMAYGMKPKGHEDYPEIKRRMYDYGEVKVMAFLKWAGGTKCEFRQVGVEEKPVYELVCKEGERDLAG